MKILSLYMMLPKQRGALTGAVPAHNHSSGASGGILPAMTVLQNLADGNPGGIFPLVATPTSMLAAPLPFTDMQVGDFLFVSAGFFNHTTGFPTSDILHALARVSGTAEVQFSPGSTIPNVGVNYEDYQIPGNTTNYRKNLAGIGVCDVAGDGLYDLDYQITLSAATSHGVLGAIINASWCRGLHIRPSLAP